MSTNDPSIDGSRTDVVIVGAGIVGLATGLRLLERRPDLGVLVIEKESEVAVHQTGHNSGVLHSGLYYAPGSLKATTAVAGRTAMVEFCERHHIPHDVCGKVVVATREDELERLAELYRRSDANGVPARMIDVDELGELEPHAAGIAAMHVESTGIVDYAEVCRTMARLITEAGGRIVHGTSVESLGRRSDATVVHTSAGTIECDVVVNCGGLHCDTVAAGDATRTEDDGTHIVPFRGEYYEIRGERRSLVKNLIYPVPDPSFPFLGVHLTRMMDGSVHAGPNAVLALAREGYRWRDVSAGQLRAHATDRGLWKLGRKYWKTGAGEVWRSVNKGAFVRALQRLVPELEADDLEASPAGVRAQALRPDGGLVDDFAIAETAAAVHVLNAPSPAATASLMIGASIVDRVEQRW